jgi:hypothetical protein
MCLVSRSERHPEAPAGELSPPPYQLKSQKVNYSRTLSKTEGRIPVGYLKNTTLYSYICQQSIENIKGFVCHWPAYIRIPVIKLHYKETI